MLLATLACVLGQSLVILKIMEISNLHSMIFFHYLCIYVCVRVCIYNRLILVAQCISFLLSYFRRKRLKGILAERKSNTIGRFGVMGKSFLYEFVLLLVSAFILVPETLSWSKEGHIITCRIAQVMFSDKFCQMVISIIMWRYRIQNCVIKFRSKNFLGGFWLPEFADELYCSKQ